MLDQTRDREGPGHGPDGDYDVVEVDAQVQATVGVDFRAWRPSRFRSVTRPAITSAEGPIMANGVMALRTSMTPAATSGSIGVNSIEFWALTTVAPRRPKRRATDAPPKPPPTIRTPPGPDASYLPHLTSYRRRLSCSGARVPVPTLSTGEPARTPSSDRGGRQAYDPEQAQCFTTENGSLMNELVVGVDGSDQSRSALRWAAAIAGAIAIELRVVEAWTGGDPYMANQIGEQVKAELAEYSHAALEGVTPEPQVDFEALHGGPAEAILKRVTAGSGLVLGSRGRGGFLGLLLGSVSRACIEHAPCPAMIVRQQEPPPLAGSSILVGHDGSPGARLALEWAVELSRPMQAKVMAAYVWQANASEVRPALLDRLVKDATRSIEAWAGEVSAEIQPIEIEGEPRMELVKLAERHDAGLVVVGRRGKGMVRALRMGSVASYLVTSSPIPVAVTPPPAGRDLS